MSYRYNVRDALPHVLKQRFAIGFKGEEYRDSAAGPSSAIGTTPAFGCNFNSGGGKVQTATEKRKLTIAELRRICAFPDDFILLGTYAQQWERLGRAVPPVMMSHVAATVRDQILRKI
jgi:site-specific DNA-cytosine methylase